MQFQEEQDYTKQFDMSLWVRLAHYARPFYKHLIIIAIAMLACAGGDVIFPLVLGLLSMSIIMAGGSWLFSKTFEIGDKKSF